MWPFRKRTVPEPRKPVDGSRFLELVGLSGLLSPAELTTFTAFYSADQWNKLCSNKDELANEFVTANLLTHWQAALLLSGKYKGFLLGKYKLLQLLGSGGMSSVYLARHTSIGKLVAIKVLPKSKANDDLWMARFINSAREDLTLFRNNHFFHPHDIDSAGNTHYIVMDYKPGTTLKSIVREQGPLDYLAAVNYIAQATDGLDALHNVQQLHLHLDPEHLYLTNDGVIKIMGTRFFWDTKEARENWTKPMWEEFFMPVKDNYRAPELELSLFQAGPLADIYSLGCTFYYLLTGHPPCDVEETPQRIQQYVWAKLPDLREVRPDAPPRLIEILERMLAKSLSDRYPSAGHLYRDLDAFLRDEGGDNELAYVS